MTQFAPLAGDRFDSARAGAASTAESSRAENATDGFLMGVARFVLDGDRADQIAVVTAAGVFVVDADHATARRLATFDPVLHVADLWFTGVPVAEENRIATDCQRAFHIALTAMAITTVGACQRIIDLTLDHLKQRQQFGVPIGSFQALQHKAVDMHVAIERARALSLLLRPHHRRRRSAPPPGSPDGEGRCGRRSVAGGPARHAVLRRDGPHMGKRPAVRH